MGVAAVAASVCTGSGSERVGNSVPANKPATTPHVTTTRASRPRSARRSCARGATLELEPPRRLDRTTARAAGPRRGRLRLAYARAGHDQYRRPKPIPGRFFVYRFARYPAAPHPRMANSHRADLWRRGLARGRSGRVWGELAAAAANQHQPGRECGAVGVSPESETVIPTRRSVRTEVAPAQSRTVPSKWLPP